MKLFWKLLISVESIILLIFSVFGCFLLYFFFDNSITREKEQSRQEILFFQYALLTAVESLPDSYYGNDIAVLQAAETIQKNIGGQGDIIKIYNNSGSAIYETDTYDSTLIKEELKKTAGASQVRMLENNYFIESILKMESTRGTYYLEIDKNITYIYEEREQLLNSYRMALLIAFFISVMFTMLLAVGFTKPIRRLSIETRWFADGNYKRRVTVQGNDEITELMLSFNHMADTLEKNMLELEEDARRQEDFTAAFAHELKTPLTSVIGYADMLRSQSMSDEDRLLCADYIFQQGKRLERLSYKLLELVGMKNGKINCQQIEISELGEKIEQMTEELLRKKQIKMSIQLEKGQIYGDVDLLLSLFGNLIDNARKACEESGRIWLVGQRTELGYCLLVQDNGRGIPVEEIHKITEAFYMVDKSRARKEGGAGIGMALCKRIVELHNAEWKITSEVGKGTRVTIDFPTEEREVEAD